MIRTTPISTLCLLAMTVSSSSFLFACSDDSTDPNSLTQGNSGSAGSSGAAGTGGTAGTSTNGTAGAGGTGGTAGSANPVFVVSTGINAGTPSGSSLLATSTSIDEGTTIDVNSGVEIPGIAFLFGPEKKGSVYMITGTSPVATRYDIGTDGAITKGPDLSFQQFGVAQANSLRSMIFVSETKAYLLDDTTLQAIVWNPSTMTTTGNAIDLSAIGSSDAGVSTFFAYEPRLRGTEIVIAAAYYDANFDTVQDAGIAVLDTTNDTVTAVKDNRCPGLTTSTVAPNGDIYFGTDPYYGAIQRKDPTKAGGCVVRLPSGQNTLDQSFLIDVKTITGGHPGGGAIPADGNNLYVRAFDESLFPVTDATTQFDILGAEAWLFWKVDLANPTNPATKETTIPAAAGDLKSFSSMGMELVPNCGAGYQDTTLYAMNHAGGPKKLAKLKGYASAVLQVH